MNKSKPCILIADDDQKTRKMLSTTLDVSGFKIIESTTGAETLRLAASHKPDAIILDIILPDISGDEIIERLRQWSKIPVLVVSEVDDASDIINAFEIGANDYVNKPFNVDILIARLKAALRDNYHREVGDNTLKVGDISINLTKHEVRLNNEAIDFSPKEYDLLHYFIKNKGKMLTHKQILKEVWGDAHVYDTQYLRVYVMQIRHKIKDDSETPLYIATEAGVGYRFDDFSKDK
jgi:two-component system KDP operon response regulator KdpE